MLIITGMPGSGKDEFIKVARTHGWKDYHMGDIVRKYARLNNINENDGSIGSFSNRERELYGMDIWARRLVEEIKEKNHIIVDGLRNMEEFNYFQKVSPNLVLVAIHTDRDERLKRIIKRSRPDDIREMDELVKRDERELSWGIGKAISLSDYMIVNDGTLEEFKANVESLLERIEKEHPEV